MTRLLLSILPDPLFPDLLQWRLLLTDPVVTLDSSDPLHSPYYPLIDINPYPIRSPYLPLRPPYTTPFDY